MTKHISHHWAIKWKYANRYGPTEYLEGDGNGGQRLFSTRREAQGYIKERYGYIAKRRDLRVEPHCWRMPKAVRVEVVVKVDAFKDTHGPYCEEHFP